MLPPDPTLPIPAEEHLFPGRRVVVKAHEPFSAAYEMEVVSASPTSPRVLVYNPSVPCAAVQAVAWEDIKEAI